MMGLICRQSCQASQSTKESRENLPPKEGSSLHKEKLKNRESNYLYYFYLFTVVCITKTRNSAATFDLPLAANFFVLEKSAILIMYPRSLVLLPSLACPIMSRKLQ